MVHVCRNLQVEYIDLYLVHFPVSLGVPEGPPSAVFAKEDLAVMDMERVCLRWVYECMSKVTA
uniref:NADP-dependent oxidoreductase domain-containing protein n=1 Tax=Oryza rufipogon TaxID=4529 RepID=A0A0E0QVN2_ORYRU